jgi:hypothetical protein
VNGTSNQPAALSTRECPSPPNLRWYWLLALGVLTAGIFYEIWMVLLAAWLLKLARSWREWLVLGCFVISALLVLIDFAVTLHAAHYRLSIHTIFFPSDAGIQDWAPIPALIGIFLMRDSLQRHYREHGPIVVTLSALMTFFFQGLYIQHHLSEVADFQKHDAAGTIHPA